MDTSNAPKLYHDCAKCDRSGHWTPPSNGYSHPMSQTCPDCNGKGVKPTPEGTRIIELMERFGFRRE